MRPDATLPGSIIEAAPGRQTVIPVSLLFFVIIMLLRSHCLTVRES
jgi:hypothetical protein